MKKTAINQAAELIKTDLDCTDEVRDEAFALIWNDNLAKGNKVGDFFADCMTALTKAYGKRWMMRYFDMYSDDVWRFANNLRAKTCKMCDAIELSAHYIMANA